MKTKREVLERVTKNGHCNCNCRDQCPYFKEKIGCKLLKIGAMAILRFEKNKQLRKENEILKNKQHECYCDTSGLKATRITEERYKELYSFAYEPKTIGNYVVYDLDVSEEIILVYNLDTQHAFTINTADFKKALYFVFSWYI